MADEPLPKPPAAPPAAQPAQPDAPDQPDQPDRRSALSRLAIAAGGVIGVAALAGPAGVALSPLVRNDPGDAGEGWMRVDAVSRFKVGAPPARVVLRRDVRDQWLVRRGDTLGAVLVERLSDKDFRVLSSVCPHLGCSVVWQEDKTRWLCPCHKSAFTREGEIIEGGGTPNPSPRALDPLDWRVTDGALEVRWVRFKTGIPERVPMTASAADRCAHHEHEEA